MFMNYISLYVLFAIGGFEIFLFIVSSLFFKFYYSNYCTYCSNLNFNARKKRSKHHLNLSSEEEQEEIHLKEKKKRLQIVTSVRYWSQCICFTLTILMSCYFIIHKIPIYIVNGEVSIVSIIWPIILIGLFIIILCFCLKLYPSHKYDNTILLVIIQAFMVTMFSLIGKYEIVNVDHFEEKVDIVYYTKDTFEQVSVNRDYSSKPIDRYYFSEFGSTLEQSFTTADYHIKIYYDVPKEELEYYELYNRDSYCILHGSALYYDTHNNKPVVYFHFHRINKEI